MQFILLMYPNLILDENLCNCILINHTLLRVSRSVITKQTYKCALKKIIMHSYSMGLLYRYKITRIRISTLCK